MICPHCGHNIPSRAGRKPTLDDATKAALLADVAAGMSYAKIAEKYNIGASTAAWIGRAAGYVRSAGSKPETTKKT